jgi:hypothetical protein
VHDLRRRSARLRETECTIWGDRIEVKRLKLSGLEDVDKYRLIDSIQDNTSATVASLLLLSGNRVKHVS